MMKMHGAGGAPGIQGAPGTQPNGGAPPEAMAAMMKMHGAGGAPGIQGAAGAAGADPAAMAAMMKQHGVTGGAPMAPGGGGAGGAHGAKNGGSSDQMAAMMKQYGGGRGPGGVGGAPGQGQVPGQPGGAGSGGGAAGGSFPPGSVDDTLFQFCSAMAEGDTAKASEYISSKAKGLLAELRDGKMSEEKIDEITNIVSPVSELQAGSEVVSNTRRSLVNGKDQQITFVLKKEKDVHKITEMSLPKQKKR